MYPPSLIAQLVKNWPAIQETPVRFLGRQDLLEKGRDRLPISVFSGFPCGSAGKESACNVGDLGSFPGLERHLGEGTGYLLQYSGLENCTISFRSYWPKFSDTATPLTKGSWEMKYLSSQCLPEIWDL